MGAIASSIDDSLFCERCGEVFALKKPVCVGCGAAPARHWLQLTSLLTLGIGRFCNSLGWWFSLLQSLDPRFPARPRQDFEPHQHRHAPGPPGDDFARLVPHLLSRLRTEV